MDGLANWIKSHQITSFFAITFAITWGLGFSYGAVMQREQFLLLPLAVVATCGPALAGIIISTVSNTQPKQGTRKGFWISFFTGWIVSGLVFNTYNTFINHVPLSPPTIALFFITVVPVAFVIAAVYSRIPAVRNYLTSLVRLRGVWGWALLAMVLFPTSILLSAPIKSILERQPITAYPFPEIAPSLMGLIVLKFIYQLFFFNATGEETGWRGFALPRLQARTSPLVAASIIGLFWAPWHFFLWQAEGRSVLTLQFWIEMFIGHILFSLLIGWVCNRANGSILVAGIAHAAANTAFAVVPQQDMKALNLTWLIASLVLILVDRMWKRLPTNHPVVYRSPEMDARKV